MENRSKRKIKLFIRAVLLLLSAIHIVCLPPAYERRTGPMDRSDLPLKVTKVRGSVYLAEDFNYWKTNSVFYASEKGIVYFDATWTPKTARQLLWKGAVYSEADYIGVILTGFPLHRSGGLATFRARGIKVYMHEITDGLLRKNWKKMQAEMERSFDSWAPTSYKRADGVFEKELSILDGKIKVYYPGPGYSPGNVVVYFPEEKILYAGSLLARPMYFLKNARLDQYSKILADLRKRFDIEIIISGHGKGVAKPELLDYVGLNASRILNSRN